MGAFGSASLMASEDYEEQAGLFPTDSLRNGARPFPTMNFYFMKTERYKTVPYKTNALIKPIAKPAKTSIYG